MKCDPIDDPKIETVSSARARADRVAVTTISVEGDGVGCWLDAGVASRRYGKAPPTKREDRDMETPLTGRASGTPGKPAPDDESQVRRWSDPGADFA